MSTRNEDIKLEFRRKQEMGEHSLSYSVYDAVLPGKLFTIIDTTACLLFCCFVGLVACFRPGKDFYSGQVYIRPAELYEWQESSVDKHWLVPMGNEEYDPTFAYPKSTPQ